MKHLYGEFSEKQFEEYKIKLHKKMFWLILYKDPNTCGKYPDINFDDYYSYLMNELNGLNVLLYHPWQIVEIMSILQAAYFLTKQEVFDYKLYRKYILDAHALVDKIMGDDHD